MSLRCASPQTILSSSADKTTRIWSETSPGAFTCAATLTDHSAEVVGVTVHPSRKYFVTGSADGSWCFYDLDKAECLRQVRGSDKAECLCRVRGG